PTTSSSRPGEASPPARPSSAPTAPRRRAGSSRSASRRSRAPNGSATSRNPRSTSATDPPRVSGPEPPAPDRGDRRRRVRIEREREAPLRAAADDERRLAQPIAAEVRDRQPRAGRGVLEPAQRGGGIDARAGHGHELVAVAEARAPGR